MLKELKAFGRILESNIKRLSFPYKLAFAVTYACNLKCKVCSIWKKGKRNEVSFEEIDEFFRKSSRFSWVVLTGGEAFLRKDIVRIAGSVIRHCSNLGVLSIPTNGYDTGLILARVREILALKPPRLYVTVSLDGPPEVHDEIRGVRDSWRRSLETFVALEQMDGVEVVLNMTLSKYNLRCIDASLRAVKNLYPRFDVKKSMNFNIFHASAHYYANPDVIAPPADELIGDIETAIPLLSQRSVKGYLQYNYLKHCKSYLKTAASPVQCRALSASCFIDPVGELYPCHAFNRPLGNVKEHRFDLKELWNSEETLKTYEHCNKGLCPGCWSPCEAYQSINGSLGRSLADFIFPSR